MINSKIIITIIIAVFIAIIGAALISAVDESIENVSSPNVPLEESPKIVEETVLEEPKLVDILPVVSDEDVSKWLEYDIISCEVGNYEKYVESKIKITNNGPTNIKLKINFLGRDADGNTITFRAIWTDVIPKGGVSFESTDFLDNSDNFASCGIHVQDFRIS